MNKNLLNFAVDNNNKQIIIRFIVFAHLQLAIFQHFIA